jgi:Tol biopolymer transport system component
MWKRVILLSVTAILAFGIVIPPASAVSNTTGILAFSGYDISTSKAQIYTMKPNGAGGYLAAVCVTCSLSPDGGRRPEWAPGGNKIAYMAPGTNPDIYTVGIDSNGAAIAGTQTQMTGGTSAWPGEDCCPWYSRDGSKIFFHSRGTSMSGIFQIYSIPASTGCVNNDTTCPTNYSNDANPAYEGTVSLSWGNSSSPTFNKLIYRSNCGGTIAAPLWPNCYVGPPPPALPGNSIWWMDVTASGPSYNKVMVLEQAGCSGTPQTCNGWFTPAFGPKGNNFFVVKQNYTPGSPNTYNFATLIKVPVLAGGVLGTQVDATLAGAGQFDCNPQGSRDGSFIFFARSNTRCDSPTGLGGITSNIYRVPVNGGAPTQISTQGKAVEVAESP